jgi:iron(III) transport system substrate-binding protein
MSNSHVNLRHWWKLLLSMSITMVGVLALSYVYAAAPVSTTPNKEARWNEVVAAAKKEGKVIWYESSEEEEMRSLIADFQKRYPDIKLMHVRLRGTDAAVRIVLETQAGAATADVGFGGADTIFELEKKGVLKTMDWDELNISPTIIAGPTAVWLACSTYVVVYNSKHVSEADAPKKWEDLIDPKWKHKIGLWIKPDPMVALVPAANWGHDKVLQLVRNLKSQEPKLYDSTFTLASAIAAGEISVGWGIYHSTLPSIKKGAPIKFAFCDPTPVSPLFSFATKGGKNPNAAKVFLAWLESKEGLMSYEAATLRGNPLLPGTKTAEMLKGLRVCSWKIEDSDQNAKVVKEFGDILERK